MWKKLFVIFAVFLYVEHVSSNAVPIQSLDKQIEEMWVKVNAVKHDLKEVDTDELTNKTSSSEISPAITDTLEKISKNITDELSIHYEAVEKKARHDGVLKYDDPELTAAVLAMKHKDEFVAILKADIMATEGGDEKTKKMVIDVVEKVVNSGAECLQSYIDEVKAHPDVWDHADADYFWRSLDSSEENLEKPTSTDPKYLAAFTRMENIVTKCQTDLMEHILQLFSIFLESVGSKLDEALAGLEDSSENKI